MVNFAIAPHPKGYIPAFIVFYLPLSINKGTTGRWSLLEAFHIVADESVPGHI